MKGGRKGVVDADRVGWRFRLWFWWWRSCLSRTGARPVRIGRFDHALATSVTLRGSACAGAVAAMRVLVLGLGYLLCLLVGLLTGVVAAMLVCCRIRGRLRRPLRLSMSFPRPRAAVGRRGSRLALMEMSGLSS